MDILKNKYDLTLEALEELTAELTPTKVPSRNLVEKTQRLVDRTPLEQAIGDFHPLHQDALFLGVAHDGLPILLNLRDPSPGPLLIAGDEGSGKTQLIQTIAQAITLIHEPGDVQFGVVTNYPEEWQIFDKSPHCVGIFPTYHDTTAKFITSLSDWAHNNRGNDRTTLLLLDDLESLTQTDTETQQALRWLFLRGPNRQVWPITTLNASRAQKVSPWLDAFRTRLFGFIKNSRQTEALVPAHGAELNSLEPGTEFQMREGHHWVRFWIPSID